MAKPKPRDFKLVEVSCVGCGWKMGAYQISYSRSPILCAACALIAKEKYKLTIERTT